VPAGLATKTGYVNPFSAPRDVVTPSGARVTLQAGEGYRFTQADMAVLNAEGKSNGVLGDLADEAAGILNAASKGFTGATIAAGFVEATPAAAAKAGGAVLGAAVALKKKTHPRAALCRSLLTQVE